MLMNAGVSLLIVETWSTNAVDEFGCNTEYMSMNVGVSLRV